ncbi:MAG: CHASE2 domain-containing protein [Desulfuromonadales bacterium]|nr:CHASE2 domain-containing protein [Desulfuromonadales bacterium]
MQQPIHNERRLTWILLLAGLFFSLFICVVYLMYPSSVASTNNRTTDVVMSLVHTKPASGSIVIVDIDENSLSRYGQWPWSRDRLAQLLRAINAAGAAGIGLDLILAEPDRTFTTKRPKGSTPGLDYDNSSPGNPVDPNDNDHILANTLAKGPFVLGYEFLFGGKAKPEAACGLHPPGIVWINKADKVYDQHNFINAQDVVCNRQVLSGAVSYSGFLNATPDDDGILRRMPMLIQFNDDLYPSLALALLLQHGKHNQIEILRKKSGRIELIVGNKSIPVDTQGNMVVPFSQRADVTSRISAEDLLAGKNLSSGIRGKIVLVGSSAAGLTHVYQTPAGPLHTHVDVHAQVLETVLTGQHVIRAREFLFWEVLIGLLVVVCASLTVSRMGILPSAAVCAAVLAGIWAGMLFLFQSRGYLFSPLLPTVLVVTNYAVLTIFKSWKIQVYARERAESTLILLKSSENTLSSIVRVVPDIIFRLDPSGSITFISPAISKYTASPDDLIGHSIFDLVVPNDMPKAQYRLNEKRTGERATRDLELRLLLPNSLDEGAGDIRYFRVSAEGVYQGDTPCSMGFIGTQGIIHDITEQKKLEEKLLDAQKMEAIGSLAAGVAHDLNNVLSGLVSYPELLLMELPPDSPLREKISIIQRSGEKAAAIVQDLLALGRRGAKNSELINLNEIIFDYLMSLEFDTIQKDHPGATLETDLAPDLLNIMGSRFHLAKVIMNLLSNACEAMPAGGKVKLSSCNRYIDTPLMLYEEIPPGEYVSVSVTDEGIGIADEDLRKVFEPFYSKKSMRRSGSGLGMTIIWATVKDFGGYIDLQSREGQGTRFELFLPATRDGAGSPSRVAVLDDYIGTENILVVDDVPEQRMIATNMLTKLGYAVTSVASGEAAVEHLREHVADLVVLDMIMPGGMDGLETYLHVIALRPGLRAIITSGFSESDRVKALRQMGVGEYVQKPYTLEKLGMAVRSELDRT